MLVDIWKEITLEIFILWMNLKAIWKTSKDTQVTLKDTQSDSGIFQSPCKIVDFLWEQLGVFKSLGLWESQVASGSFRQTWSNLSPDPLFLMYQAHRARNDTRIGYFVLRSFPAPRMNFEGCLLNILNIIIILIYIFNLIYLIKIRAHGNFAGIPHPWTRDGNSAGTGAGQPKMPRGTPVSITNLTPQEKTKLYRYFCKESQDASALSDMDDDFRREFFKTLLSEL